MMRLSIRDEESKVKNTRKPMSHDLLLPVVALALLACGRAEPEQKSLPQETTQPSADETDPSSVRHAPPSGPSPAQIYFGDVPLDPLFSPLALKPIPRSSVVLVIVDALNAKHMGLFGYHRPTTPRLDELAQKGLVLTNHVSNSSWTRPSFTTIITGLTKQQHNVELSGRNLQMEITTLAERFRQAGYRTAGFVGNPLARKIWGFGQGFQLYVDTKTLNKAFPRDEILIDRAITWLEKNSEDPFFLMLFLTSPHTPYRPRGEHRRFLKELPPGDVIQYPFKEYVKPLPKADHDRIVAAYDGDVAYADEQVGRLYDYLHQSALLNKTSLLITADHGEIFGEHGCYIHAYHMWEPVLRVPFLLLSPILTKRGLVENRPHTHVDIAPTLLDLAGLPIPESFSGISLLKSLADPTVLENRRQFSQYNAHGIRRQTIRQGRWKLIHHNQVDKKAVAKIDDLHPTIPQPKVKDLPSLAMDGERYELYDLLTDPQEVQDLYAAKQNDPPIQALIQALGPYLEDRTAAPQLSPETLKALQAAGYIDGPPTAQR